jgi:hypothetical protein
VKISVKPWLLQGAEYWMGSVWMSHAVVWHWLRIQWSVEWLELSNRFSSSCKMHQRTADSGGFQGWGNIYRISWLCVCACEYRRISTMVEMLQGCPEIDVYAIARLFPELGKCKPMERGRCGTNCPGQSGIENWMQWDWPQDRQAICELRRGLQKHAKRNWDPKCSILSTPVGSFGQRGLLALVNDGKILTPNSKHGVEKPSAVIQDHSVGVFPCFSLRQEWPVTGSFKSWLREDVGHGSDVGTSGAVGESVVVQTAMISPDVQNCHEESRYTCWIDTSTRIRSNA